MQEYSLIIATKLNISIDKIMNEWTQSQMLSVYMYLIDTEYKTSISGLDKKERAKYAPSLFIHEDNIEKLKEQNKKMNDLLKI